MQAFATVEQYRAKYASDDVTDEVLARLLLEATDTICSELDSSDFDYSDPTERFTFRLMRVCCDATHRTVERMASKQSPDVKQESITQAAGSYSGTHSVTYAPYVGVTLTSAERDLLGIDTTACGYARPFAGGDA